MRGLTVSIIAATALGLAGTAFAQAQQAGVSAAVRGKVELARASQNIVGKQVESGDPIFLGDAITSGTQSGMQIMLLDETVFTIGPNSEISIDEFVYDPETDAGKVTASVAKGAFRFITGKIARKRPEDMTVRLPTATIGIRGTIVAGVVRSAPGADPAADEVFNLLEKDSPGAKDARDFVILLGPGHENNTNDKGGAFVFTRNPPKTAQRGLSAGAELAQAGTAPDWAQKRGGFGIGSNTTLGGVGGLVVSRNGSAAVGFEDGDPQGPFIVSEFVRLFSRVFPANIQGTSSPNDPRAQQASGTPPGNARSISGETIADAGALGGELGRIQDGSLPPFGEIPGDPATFDFADLRAITTGQALFSESSLSVGAFTVGSLNIDLFFNNQTLQFNLNSISGGGVSSGQLICNGSCSISYANLSGPAIFTESSNPATDTSGCDSCSLTIAITSASSSSATANVTLEHDGSTGSAAISSN